MIVSEGLFYMKLYASGQWDPTQRGKKEKNRQWDSNTIPVLKTHVKGKTDAARDEWKNKPKKNKGTKRGPWIRALIERKRAQKGVVVPWRLAPPAPPPPRPPSPPDADDDDKEPEGSGALSKRELQLQAAMRRAVIEEQQRRHAEMVAASRAMVMLAIEDGEEVEQPPAIGEAPEGVQEVSDDDGEGFRPAASASSKPASKAMPRGASSAASAASASSSPPSIVTESRRAVPKRITGKQSPPKDPENPQDRDEK